MQDSVLLMIIPFTKTRFFSYCKCFLMYITFSHTSSIFPPNSVPLELFKHDIILVMNQNKLKLDTSGEKICTGCGTNMQFYDEFDHMNGFYNKDWNL